MKKNSLIALLTILSVIIATLIWDYIKLPYNYVNQPFGEYSKINYNPINETLRYIFFIILPILTFFLSYFYFYKNKIFSIREVINTKFDNNPNIINLKKINFFFYIIILLLFFSFLSLEIESNFGSLDPFHEGTLLTPAKNFLLTGGLWTNTYIEYGLFGNFHPIIVWKIFSVESLGSLRFFEAFILLLTKFLIVYLCKKITEHINLDLGNSTYYFIFLSLFALTLVDYGSSSSIPSKGFLTVSFLLILFYSFHKNKNIYIPNLAIGLYSSLGLLWWIDVGAYINFLIFGLFLFLIIRKEYKKIFIILIGVIFGYFLIYVFLPKSEIIAFIKTTSSIIELVEWTDGLVYPTPFLSGDFRSTKALIFLILAGILIIILNFDKRINTTKDLKIFFSFLYILSLINFKSALVRSDSVHIKSSTGFLELLLFAIVLFFILKLLIIIFKDNKVYKFFNKFHFSISFLGLIVFYFFITAESINFKRIVNSFDGIKKFVYQSDENYLSENFKNMLAHYEKISLEDRCIQVFTNEAAIPYFLNKPTCSKFYSMWMTGSIKNQKDLIEDLKTKQPKIILFSSEQDSYYDSKKRLPLVLNYINSNYSFHSKIKYWTFVKLN